MKIIRNKYLTHIVGYDIELKMPTKKYDDIVGIDPKLLPVFEELDEQEREMVETVEFNDKTISIDSLMEYSDMNRELYISSIFNAATKFEKADLQIKRRIMQSILLLFLPSFKNSSSRCDQNIVPVQLADEYRRENPSGWNTGRWAHTYHIMISLAEPKNSLKIIEEIVDYWDIMTKSITLFDSNNNRYRFPRLNRNEVGRVLEEFLCNHAYMLNALKDIMVVGIDFFLDIITRTKTWKHFQLGVLYLEKNGEPEALVDILGLKTEQEYLEEKRRKYPKPMIALLDSSRKIGN